MAILNIEKFFVRNTFGITLAKHHLNPVKCHPGYSGVIREDEKRSDRAGKKRSNRVNLFTV
ncbi:MAG: hypothetical protein IIA88_04340 [Bacteroidetes bacterium]|nr:hypothetical protein [Bacteroidota bacterium]